MGIAMNGGPIANVISTSSPGTLSEATGNYGVGGVLTINSFTATSNTPFPNLTSSTANVESRGTGSAKLYVSEIGETNLSFAQFVSTFTVGAYVGQPTGSLNGITLSTYATSCGGTCDASDAFATSTPALASQLFTGNATQPATDTDVPGDLTSEYVVTLVYDLTWSTPPGNQHGAVDAHINLSNQGAAAPPPPTTPLPAALPLFASGLGALGLLGWRKKRKAV